MLHLLLPLSYILQQEQGIPLRNLPLATVQMMQIRTGSIGFTIYCPATSSGQASFPNLVTATSRGRAAEL